MRLFGIIVVVMGVKGQKPHIIVMIGKPGVGKSYFAEKFSDTFNAPCIDYLEIQRIARDNEHLAGELLNYVLDRLLPLKHTIVIDGPGGLVAERKDVAAFASKHGYTTLFVWVQVDDETAEYRSLHSKTARLTAKEYVARSKEFETPRPRENVVVISGKHTFASQARTVLKKLSGDSPKAPRSPLQFDRSPAKLFTSRARVAVSVAAEVEPQAPSEPVITVVASEPIPEPNQPSAAPVVRSSRPGLSAGRPLPRFSRAKAPILKSRER